MASISGLTTSQLKSRYRDKVEIYVEGRDDISIYKNYWFPQLADRVSFISAEDGVVPISGCVGVERNVLAQRQVGIDAYGLIDRDAVHDIAHANETDDHLYIQGNYSSNPYVYYTVRWELENYLIDPDIWEQERVNAKTQGNNKRNSNVVINEILSHCQILIAHAAANVVRQLQGMPKIPDGFGTQAVSRQAYEIDLFSTIMQGATVEQKALYAAWVTRIEAFDMPGSTPSQRLAAISRRVHGKALLMRFFKAYQIQDDRRFSVAFGLSGRVPQELSDKVQSWLR
jgi:hypothetical protein